MSGQTSSELEITALASATPATTKQPQSVAAPSSSATARVTDQPRLFELIVIMLREGGRPMTALSDCRAAFSW